MTSHEAMEQLRKWIEADHRPSKRQIRDLVERELSDDDPRLPVVKLELGTQYHVPRGHFIDNQESLADGSQRFEIAETHFRKKRKNKKHK